MDLVRQFDAELSCLYESKRPYSKTKILAITSAALRARKLYKHVVQSVEKSIRDCNPELKVPGLYVIDSIVRQSRHSFGSDEDVFAPRFARNLRRTFIHLFNCLVEDRRKIVRVIDLWKESNIFEPEVIQELFALSNKSSDCLALEVELSSPADSNISDDSMEEESVSGEPWKVPSESSNQTTQASVIQQLQQLLTRLLDFSEMTPHQNKNPDKKIDQGKHDEEDDTARRVDQQKDTDNDYVSSILSNREFLQQLLNLQQTLERYHQHQLEEKDRVLRVKKMKLEEQAFERRLAEAVPNLHLPLSFLDDNSLEKHLNRPPPYFPKQSLSFQLNPPTCYPRRSYAHRELEIPDEVIVLDSSSESLDFSGSRSRSKRSRTDCRSRSRSRSQEKRKRI